MTKQRKGKLVVIISSTGGPKALHQLIPMLDKNLDAPVVVVQHMPKGFTQSLANRLDEVSSIRVTEAQDGEILEKSHVYIARGGYHIKLHNPVLNQYQIRISDEAPVQGLKPCANVTLESICECSFESIVCTVLTGMGMDGCNGIEKLRRKQNIFTIAQDKESCVVYGMPKAVVECNMADLILPLKEIGKTINMKTGVR